MLGDLHTHSHQPPATQPPVAYDPTFNKSERVEFASRVANLAKLSVKLRTAFAQVSGVVSELGSEIRELRHGRVCSGLIDASNDSLGNQIESVAASFELLSRALNNLNPTTIQFFEGPAQTLAATYVTTFANFDREFHSRQKNYAKAEKKLNATVKYLQLSKNWKLSDRAKNSEVNTAIDKLETLKGEWVAYERSHTMRVWKSDTNTLVSACALIVGLRDSASALFGHWASSSGAQVPVHHAHVKVPGNAVAPAPAVCEKIVTSTPIQRDPRLQSAADAILAETARFVPNRPTHEESSMRAREFNFSIRTFPEDMKAISSIPPTKLLGPSLKQSPPKSESLAVTPSSSSSVSSASLPRGRSSSTHSLPRTNLKSALRSTGSVSSATEAENPSSGIAQKRSSTFDGGLFEKAASGNTLVESGTLQKKSVHFTNAEKPMVEFWDCSDSRIIHYTSSENGSECSNSIAGGSIVDDFHTGTETEQEANSKATKDGNVLQALYPNVFVAESTSKILGKPVQHIGEKSFSSEYTAQKRVGPSVYFPPQADIQSEAGSVVGDVLHPQIAKAFSDKDLVYALFKYIAREQKEMSFEKGDLVEVIKRAGNWIYGTKITARKDPVSVSTTPRSAGATRGAQWASGGAEIGWIPSSFVAKYSVR
ncbi:hypothetical protein HDU83_007222 [Entophlyctis luteolus]|nr:hypothetical protein HDU83_007222 [Entophlyctis luteolus]